MDQDRCARLETLHGEPAVLEGVRADGDLRGLLLEMSVEQRFRNASAVNIEVVYSFPLPWGAVLLGVDVVLGGQRLTGTVVERRAAERRYEDALAEGQAAIMLEKCHDGSFSLSLGNLAAGETCEVTLRYAQILQFEQGGLRLPIPLTIAPRYGDPVRDGGLQPHQVPVTDALAAYPFDIRLRLHGALARARVASPSHPIGVALEGPSGAETLAVSLARRGDLDRDFVLILDRLAQGSVAVLGRDTRAADPIVALASFCPKPPGATTAASAPLAVKILVDCSGSMTGDSMEAARRALHAVLPQLGPADRFSLSRFGSQVEHRSRGLWPTTQATRAAAARWIAGLEADLGGTEMELALVSTCALAHEGACDLLLVTDGEIDAIDRTVAAARGSGHRIFAVGIGSSPAEPLLRRLAESTGGACDFVAPGEAVEPAILRMFARLRSPRLTDLTLLWPEGCALGWVSPLGASVFEGDTVNAFAWLGSAPKGAVRLLGAPAPGAPREEIACAVLAAVPAGDAQAGQEPSDTLARVAAAARIRALEAAGADAPEVVALAVAYRLVTERTNFLLVHVRPQGEAATEMPELRKVAQMLPAGWGGMGSVVHRRVSVAPCPASPADWDLPAVCDGSRALAPEPFKQAESAARLDFGSDSDLDYLDFPAFLRRQNDPTPAPRIGPYPGLAPLKLCNLLRRTPQAQWPRTYADLAALGLGRQLLDWLELVVGVGPDGPLAEETVVATFVYCLSQDELYDSLTRPGGLRGRLKAILRRLHGPSAGGPGPDARGAIDGALAERILTALHGTTAQDWPAAVYALDSGILAE